MVSLEKIRIFGSIKFTIRYLVVHTLLRTEIHNIYTTCIWIDK